MKQVFLNVSQDVTMTSSDEQGLVFSGFSSAQTSSATAHYRSFIAPVSMRVNKIFAEFVDVDPTSTFSVRLDLGRLTLQNTIGSHVGPQITCNGTESAEVTLNQTVAVGEGLHINYNNVSGVANGSEKVRWTVETEIVGEPYQYFLGAGNGNNLPSDGVTEYNCINASGGWVSQDRFVHVIMPHNATVKAFYVRTQQDCSGYEFFITKNQTKEATSSLTFSTSSAENVTGLNISYSKGDTIAIGCTSTAGTANTRAAWGVLFESENPAESAMMIHYNDIDSSSEEYVQYHGHIGTGQASPTLNTKKVKNGSTEFTLKSPVAAAVVNNTVIGDDQIIHRHYKNDVQQYSVTIDNGDGTTLQESPSTEITVADGDTLHVGQQHLNTPDATASDIAISWIQFIPENVTYQPDVVGLTLSVPNDTINIGTSASYSPDQVDLTFNVQGAQVFLTGNVTYLPAPVVFTFNILEDTTLGSDADHQPDVVDLTFSIPSPSVSYGTGATYIPIEPVALAWSVPEHTFLVVRKVQDAFWNNQFEVNSTGEVQWKRGTTVAIVEGEIDSGGEPQDSVPPPKK